jgi:hypothetical protein
MRLGMIRFTLVAASLLGTALLSAAQPIKPTGTPPRPNFNRLHPLDEIVGMMKGYASAYPEWVKLESIGKSIEGRDIWLLTVTNPRTGAPDTKPAMYVDGNTHANEVQGTEASLYTLNFLLNNYGKLDRITELLDRATFYFVPVVNPDGRTLWFKGPATPHFPRTVMFPIDDDRDGLFDEDGYDDMNGDGLITQMRKKVGMGQGTHRLHPKDPRILVPVEKDELGDYIMLGWEGFDNDGDGLVNEDLVGYVDPNRTWGYNWQPRYVQSGSSFYPLQIPETRSIATWALTKPNLAGVQSFHNYGQMILRGPGSKAEPPYPAADLKAYDYIAKEGERMLPGYRYLISWKDLYTVYGGTTDHFYRVHGAISYTNELYQPPVDVDKDGKVTPEEEMMFNDLVTLGRQFVPWTKVNHPQYGEIEVGGMRHDVGRVPENWLLEEDMHRNAAFVLLHAHHLPKITFGDPTVERVEGNLWKVIVPVINERAIPTMTAVARQDKLHRPDIATIEGAKVLSSGIVTNVWLDRIDLQKHRPERLMVEGVPGLGATNLFFLVEGRGTIGVRYDSPKGGVISRKIELR